LAAPAGTLCLAMPGDIHTGDAAEEGWTYWTMHVPPDSMRSLAEEAGLVGEPAFSSGVIEDVEAAHRFGSFFAGLDEDLPLAHEVRAVEALGQLIRRHCRGLYGSPHAVAKAVVRVRDLLAARAVEAINLDELETEAGMSRFRLIRAFRATYGLPPHAWQMQMRLARAKEMIRAGLPLAEVAAAAGFADQAHMTRQFVRFLGHTPGCYGASRRHDES